MGIEDLPCVLGMELFADRLYEIGEKAR